MKEKTYGEMFGKDDPVTAELILVEYYGIKADEFMNRYHRIKDGILRDEE